MIRRIRLVSGLVLLAYVAMHLVNHALGLISLDAMSWTLDRVVAPFWALPPMRISLYAAFFVHYALALRALWQRQTLRLRGGEFLQLVLGFTIPMLLASCQTTMIATRGGARLRTLMASWRMVYPTLGRYRSDAPCTRVIPGSEPTLAASSR